MDKRIVALIAAAALALLVWWIAGTFAPPAPVPAETRTGDAGASVASGDLGAATATGDDSARREPAGDAAAERTALTSDATSLTVHVSMTGDRPLAGCLVYVFTSHTTGSMRPLARLRTNAVGLAEAIGLPIGRLVVATDRGGRAEGELRPGHREELRIALDGLIDVHGVVVDKAGTPVPHASIWLTSIGAGFAGGAVVGAADDAGRFALHNVPRQRAIGAFAPGHAPSELVALSSLADEALRAPIELRLAGAGGGLRGRVTGPDGGPLRGALLAVGTRNRTMLIRGVGHTERWQHRLAETDADGRYAVDGLVAGEQVVEVWVPKLPLWRGSCTIVAGEVTTLDVQLATGANVFGVVSDVAKGPVAGALVRAYPTRPGTMFVQSGQIDHEGQFGFPATITAADGSYELSGIAPGEVHLFARAAIARSADMTQPWAALSTTVAAGDRREWNPRIEPGPSIRGVIRYRDGVPMAGHVVSVVEVDGKGRQALPCNREGRFQFFCLERKAYDVAVQYWDAPKGTPPLGARNVFPDGEELQLIAPFDSPKKLAEASVRGVLDDHGGRLPAGIRLSGMIETGRSWYTNCKVDGMRFSFAGVEPGRRRVTLLADETPILYSDWFELAPGEDKDLGVLTTQPGGRLRIVLSREAGTESCAVTLYVRPKEGGHARSAKLEGGDGLLLDNLCTGELEVYGYGNGVASIHEQARIAAGETTELRIALRAAAWREIVIDYPTNRELRRIRVCGADGRDRLDESPDWVQADRPYRRSLQLAVGAYTLHVETDDGRKHEMPFEMVSLAADQPPVTLTLR